jgi:integrase/recombinase XerD
MGPAWPGARAAQCILAAHSWSGAGVPERCTVWGGGRGVPAPGALVAHGWRSRPGRGGWHLVTVRKLAPATTNKHLAALDDFALSRGLGKADVKRQELLQRAPRALDAKATTRFLRAVEATPSARDRAIALVPLYSGARIAEVARLDTDDVALSARLGRLRLVGKGERIRTVPIHARLREALSAWLAERPSWPGADTPVLFLGRRSTRLTTDAIGDVLDRISLTAGLEDAVTAHKLRHTFATTMLRSGVDVVTVSQLLGHARLETIKVYTQPTEEDLGKAIESLPVDR